MTITFNPLEFFRFAFIVGWLVFAGLFTFGTLFTAAEKEEYIMMAITWILCVGSAAVLYFGR